MLLLLVFAILATADGVRCPDGCRSTKTADGCSSSGSCAFCNGGMLVLSPLLAVSPSIVVLAAPGEARVHPPTRPSPVPERPPRLG